MSTPVLLRVEDLTTRILTAQGTLTVLERLSFDVHSGETLALVGESGSGKSMTMLSLTGLLPSPPALVVAGRAQFEGQNLLQLDENTLRHIRGNRIGMIFQEPMSALNPLLSIGDQIAETLWTHRSMSRSAARAEAVRLLDRVRIPQARLRAGQYPHQLSGGMRQRAVIAAAIACKPALLIADEPTTALDATVEAEILALLRDLQREDGLSIILITHDMGVVREMADRVVVMLAGRSIETGRCEDILERPQHDYTRTLIAATVPPADSVATALPALPVKPALLLEVQDLSVVFALPPQWPALFKKRHLLAVDNVSFTLAAGETLALVGESGSGKSTVARTIAGLQRPGHGRIRIAGCDIADDGRDSGQSGIQLIFQDPQASLDPRFSAARIVSEPLLLRDRLRRAELHDAAAELLVRVGLPVDYLQRYPHELSGGQRQRLGIARAISVSPQMIIADEAVSALDASTRLQILDLLGELQRELGIAYLFITHDMAVVKRLAHRVAVMRAGRIVEIGPAAAIMHNPQHPYTRLLWAAARRQTLPDYDISGATGAPAPAMLKVADDHYVAAVG